ncbi:diaminopimelate epimerase [Aureibacillus halotolerans]|uniref:Diaminopimelate epimerase n=1 Tax=Aureibacillus halotolerans TaxID=1508390 RepID=A0A4R6U264_9BACI|nr:diaminopimelate epimerase [Aureibacillus halotolerans]
MKRTLPFVKMEALGNNYIYLDCIGEDLPTLVWEDVAVDVSDRNTGIGSDGLILMMPSTKADLRMRVFNMDGSEAKNCGNGLRCVAKLFFDRGYSNGKKQFTIETLSGVVIATVISTARNEAKTIEINMGYPQLEAEQIPFLHEQKNEPLISYPLHMDNNTWHATMVSMGNPHAVIFVDSIAKAPVETVGKKLATDVRFPEGVNVEFVQKVSESEYHFAVWERGSGRTRACGTGACAAGVAAVLLGHANRDEDLLIHLEGGELQIRWNAEGEVIMTGDARIICAGDYYM